MQCRYRTAALLLPLLLGAGCATWQIEPVAPESLFAEGETGALRVTRADGSRVIVEHPVLRADTLFGIVHGTEGRDIRIPVTDVRQLETGGFNAGRTFLLFLAAGAAALAGVLIWLASAGGD